MEMPNAEAEVEAIKRTLSTKQASLEEIRKRKKMAADYTRSKNVDVKVYDNKQQAKKLRGQLAKLQPRLTTQPTPNQLAEQQPAQTPTLITQPNRPRKGEGLPAFTINHGLPDITHVKITNEVFWAIHRTVK